MDVEGRQVFYRTINIHLITNIQLQYHVKDNR